MSRLLITLATFLLPPSRRAWVQAMQAEYDALPEEQGAFALGCLGASLRENVTTGEGWARMGFGVILSVTLLWMAGGVWGLVDLIIEPRKRFIVQVWSVLLVSTFVFTLALIARASVKAMAAPTNRFHLAEIGLGTAPKLLLALGVVATISVATQAYFHAFVLPVWLDLERAKFFLIDGFVTCAVVLVVGFLSQKGARIMLLSGLVGAFVVTVSGVIAYGLDRGKLKGVFVASDQFVVLLLLFAVSGAILMWMERPAKSVR
jgi:hypothetical protein